MWKSWKPDSAANHKAGLKLAADDDGRSSLPSDATATTTSTDNTHSNPILERRTDITSIDLDSPSDSSKSSDFEIIDAVQVARDKAREKEEHPYTAFVQNAERQAARRRARYNPDRDMDGNNDYNSPEWQQAGANAEEIDLAGPGAHGRLDCTVSKPQKEAEGTQNAYISYLVTTNVGLMTASKARLTSTDRL